MAVMTILTLSSNSTDPKNTNYMAMGVKAFFDNGGSQLYVSRVFVPKSAADTGIATSGVLPPRTSSYRPASPARAAIKASRSS